MGRVLGRDNQYPHGRVIPCDNVVWASWAELGRVRGDDPARINDMALGRVWADSWAEFGPDPVTSWAEGFLTPCSELSYMELVTGIEPVTPSLRVTCSTSLATPAPFSSPPRPRRFRANLGPIGTRASPRARPRSSRSRWCDPPESNWGHPHFQCGALPTELGSHEG